MNNGSVLLGNSSVQPLIRMSGFLSF